MSFLLVDRIHQFTPGKGAKGNLRIPPDAPDFPLALAVEAIGQLAAYVAMESTGFAMRPVAATAGEVVATGAIRPGDSLELEIDIRALRSRAIRYGGVARIGGDAAVEVHRCTGAMLPMAAFDDTERVRAELEQLRTRGAPARALTSRAESAPRKSEPVFDETGRMRTTLLVPRAAPLYAEHFPRRPVYPATLLLDAKIGVARDLVARRAPEGSPPPFTRAVRGVKVRAFIPPGARVEVVVEEIEKRPSDRGRLVRMDARTDGERVSTASVLLEA